MTSEESNFLSWAREELTQAGLFAHDSDYEGMLGDEVMKLVQTFDDAGHSGFSAAMTVGIFGRLARWEPLAPLTNDPLEWMHIAEERAGQPNLWQSKRAPACFSNDGGKTYYDIDEKPGRLRFLARRLLRRPFLVYHVSQPA